MLFRSARWHHKSGLPAVSSGVIALIVILSGHAVAGGRIEMAAGPPDSPQIDGAKTLNQGKEDLKVWFEKHREDGMKVQQTIIPVPVPDETQCRNPACAGFSEAICKMVAYCQNAGA